MLVAGVGGSGGVGAVDFAFDRVQVLGAAALRGRFCQGLGQAQDELTGVHRVDHVRDGAAQGPPGAPQDYCLVGEHERFLREE